jgi:hypothetical protein
VGPGDRLSFTSLGTRAGQCRGPSNVRSVNRRTSRLLTGCGLHSYGLRVDVFMVKVQYLPAIDRSSEQLGLRDDRGDRFFYPCVLLLPHEISEVLAGGLLCPVMTGNDASPACRVSAVGLVWIWFLMKDASRHPLAEAAASPSCEMHILKGAPDITREIKKELVEMNRATMRKPNAEKLSRWGFGK